MDPKNDLSSFIIEGISFAYWILICTWWIVNYKFLNPQFTKPIHLMLSFTLFFRLLSSLFGFLLSNTPNSTLMSNYFTLAFNSSYAIFNTLLYTLLLLLSKGLNLTNDHLERQEMSKISLIMGMLYLSFSVYTINKDYFSILFVFTLCICWALTHLNTLRVFRKLTHRHRIMRNYNLSRTLASTSVKIKMMKWFRICYNLLFLLIVFPSVTEMIFYWLDEDFGRGFRLALDVESEIGQAVCVLGICVVFMPRDRGSFFQLSEFENDNDEVEVTPMYEGRVDAECMDEVESNKPFILILPHEESIKNPHSYANVCIAMPISLTFRRHSIDELQEPLIGSRLNTY